MTVLVNNNATSRLASTLSSGATTLTVTTGEGLKYPSPATGADWFPVTIIKANGALEIVYCTSRSGDVLTIQRAKEGTAAQSFTVGDRVELRLTAGALTEFLRNLLVGTVSQLAGIPTGTSFERGANAQGAYIRFADGTQIAWIDVSTTAVNQASGSVFNSLAVGPGGFPASFTAAPTVTSSVSAYGASSGVFWAGTFSAPTQTSWGSWLGMSPTSTSSFSTIRLIAIGRWF